MYRDHRHGAAQEKEKKKKEVLAHRTTFRPQAVVVTPRTPNQGFAVSCFGEKEKRKKRKRKLGFVFPDCSCGGTDKAREGEGREGKGGGGRGGGKRGGEGRQVRFSFQLQEKRSTLTFTGQIFPTPGCKQGGEKGEGKEGGGKGPHPIFPPLGLPGA